MDQFLNDAKRLVHRLYSHDNSVDILISEATSLQNKLNTMRQYHEEISKMNENANHRPRSTLILGSQLENQRIQTLEQENRELSLSLAEHQSAMELIMNKYREQVLVMMKVNGAQQLVDSTTELTSKEVVMKERIAEMANIMRRCAALDESAVVKEIEILRSLQIENDNLRELLEISGGTVPKQKYDFNQIYSSLGANSNLSILSNDSIEIPNKDSGIYENETYNNSSKVSVSKEKMNKSAVYDSIENLFSKVNSDELNNSDDDFMSNQLSIKDDVDNSFRIVTDIKPLESNFYSNAEVVSKDELNYFSKNNVNNVENNIAEDNGNEVKTHNELSDITSLISESHQKESNLEMKEQFEHVLLKENNREKVGNIQEQLEDADETEQEMMSNFISATKTLDRDSDNFEINDSQCCDQESVLEILDNVLELEDDSDEDDKDDYVEEILETNGGGRSSDEEEDAKGEFSFYKDNSQVSNNLVSDNANQNIVELCNEDKRLQECKMSNDDISDTDSEVTVTEDDLNEALSGFDSIFDDNHEIDDNEEPHVDLD